MDASNIPPGPPGSELPGGGEKKPFLGIWFDCCHTYARIYRNREQNAYQGNCPKCCRQIRVAIGTGGTSSRVFRAS